jgi:pilus assembly protein Flp/PilA
MARENPAGSVDQEVWMPRLLARFLGDESGATSIEYAIIATGLSIVILTAVNGIGSNVSTKFTSVSTALK